MKPAPFEYHAPATVDDVVGLLNELGDGAKVLAGGQSLIPMLNLRLARFEALIDIGRIPSLQVVERVDGHVVIGAAVRQSAVETSDLIGRDVGLLAAATPLIGHFQIRNHGTLGGSLAHADPAAEYPAVALALDAEMEVVGLGGQRTVLAGNFFQGMWETELAPAEVLVAVRFPVWSRPSGFAVEEVARRHGDFAIAGCACGVQLDAGRITRAAIALFGVASTPVRAEVAEQALVGADAATVDAAEIGDLAATGVDPPDDLHASGGLRRRIAAAVVRRAVERAIEEASASTPAATSNDARSRRSEVETPVRHGGRSSAFAGRTSTESRRG